MTKSVRVENADMSDYRVLVQVWDKASGVSPGPDTLAKEVELAYPTRLEDFGITSTRYLVVKELPPKPKG